MFFQPRTVEEALSLKRAHGPDAAFLAGGTDLIVMMNAGRPPARQLVDLSALSGLGGVAKASNHHYTVAGGATFAAIAKLPVHCLAEAALSVGGPQIRNRATVAGNLATASPAGDGSTALLALDTLITLRDIDASRTLPLPEFFLDYRKTALASDEMVDSIQFPADWRTGWVKLGKRGAMNISVICCAVGLSPAGVIRVAFGSAGPFPLRAEKTAAFLTEAVAAASAGQPLATPLRESVIREAESLASKDVRPIDDFRARADYRRAMAGVLLRKALRQIGLAV